MGSHEELIEVGFFDKKFKNTIRDYYTYGFKTYGNLQSKNEKGKDMPSISTINMDWKRLNNILKDFFEWSVNKKEVLFMSTDSEDMKVNPFHRIYKFCRHNTRDPKKFFNIIFALSPNITLANGIESLDLDDKVDITYEQYLRFEKDFGEKISLTSSELLCFFSDGIPLFVGENNSINNKLKELKTLGIIKDVSEKKLGAKKAVHRWCVENQYFDKIIKNGNKIDEEFEIHFTDALDFFSKYEQLGEIGNIILSRYVGNENNSVFRFKHEYYMHALNDYNLIDLLYAIEGKYWCKIVSKHAVTGEKTSIVCYPLGIRISSTSGREYLSFYDPFSRSYSNIRIEFIDSIEYINDGEVVYDGRTITVKDKLIKSDIKNALNALQYSWSASTTIKEKGNAIKEPILYDVHLRITYNSKEDFIKNRIYREKRIGVYDEQEGYIDYYVRVTDVRELHPWVRSFYSRLSETDGLEKLGFAINEDLLKMKKVYEESDIMVDDVGNNDSSTKWSIPKGTKFKTIPCEAHELLFNEYFSIYYIVFSEVLMKLYSNPNKESFSDSELMVIVDAVLERQKKSLAENSKYLLREEIKNLLKSGAFLREGIAEKKHFWLPGEDTKEKFGEWMPKTSDIVKGKQVDKSYLKKYNTKVASFYSSVLPLSILEYRWLLTIIENPKMRLFLSDKEIGYLKAVLYAEQNKDKRLPLDAIYYTDRFKISNEVQQKEIKIMKPLISSIHNHQKLFIVYKTGNKKVFQGLFAPIVIEFSKRDNMFRGYFYSLEKKQISIMNISRIQRFKVLDEKYDYDKATLELKRYRKKNTNKITIEFTDEKNVPDRILNEFAPWKKRCIYDRETKVYRLTLFYQKQDAYEIVVRLLGYGAHIKIKEKDNIVFKQYIMRIEKQIAIEQNRNKGKSRGNSHDDDMKEV